MPDLAYFLSTSADSPLDSAAPAALLISTGNTAPFSNMSCTRTMPSVSEGVAPAARQSSAGGAAPGACSVFSSNAMATAGASSVAMATFVADCLARFAAADAALAAPALRGDFLDRFDGGRAARAEVVMVQIFRLSTQMINAGVDLPSTVDRATNITHRTCEGRMATGAARSWRCWWPQPTVAISARGRRINHQIRPSNPHADTPPALAPHAAPAGCRAGWRRGGRQSCPLASSRATPAPAWRCAARPGR